MDKKAVIGGLMETLTSFFILGSVLGGAFLIWLYTKPGKKWLKDL